MNGKVLFCLIALCLLVGVVSADTIILAPLEDGRLSRTGVNEDFSNIRNGEGTAIDNTTTGYIPFSLIATTTNLKYGTLRRGFLTFNTTLPVPGTITSATLSIYGYNTGNDYAVARGNVTITSSSHGYPAAASDFNKFGQLVLTNNIWGGTWPTEQYNNFTFTNLSYINTDGLTMLMFRAARDIDSVAPETWGPGFAMYIQGYPSATAGTNKDAILTLEYTPAAGGDPPVASFTKNQTAGTAPLSVGFTDTSTNTPDEWHWWVNNVTGNDTPYEFASTQNPSITLGIGNWSFALNASNAYGWNITPGYDWVNVTAAPEGCGLLCKIVRYFWQFRLPVQLVMAS